MIRRAALACAWTLGAALGTAVASDSLAGLPRLPKPLPVPAATNAGGDELAPGVRVVPGKALFLEGRINLDHGPSDGLEVFACLRDGKTHEALVRLTASSGVTVKAAALAAFGLADGQGAPEGSGQSARGVPLALRLEWKDEEGRLVGIAGSSLVRDRGTDAAFPALPWIYVGSRFETVRFAAPDGSIQTRNQFMLDNTRSVAVNFDEPDALLGSPFPIANEDRRFEVNSALCPLAGAAVTLVLTPCVLPLTLELAADGSLATAGAPLDDAALVALLARHYGESAAPDLRAVGVRVAATTPRSADVAARSRILGAAAGAKAWVVPVFILR